MEDTHDRGSNVRQHGLVRLKLRIGGLLTATDGAHLHHLPHVNVVTDPHYTCHHNVTFRCSDVLQRHKCQMHHQARQNSSQAYILSRRLLIMNVLMLVLTEDAWHNSCSPEESAPLERICNGNGAPINVEG